MNPYQIAQDRNTALFEPTKPSDRLFEIGGELYKSAIVGDRIELLRIDRGKPAK